jgi:phospholipid transport system substrate-binding protein
MSQRVLKIFSKFILIFCFFMGAAYASAPAVQNPQVFVQGIVTSLQGQIQGKQEQLTANPNQLYAIIRTTVMPCVDINRMAGLALGPKWRAATPTQQQDFVNAFGLLLTKTYANTIVKISDYEITVSPVRGDTWQTSQYVAVNGAVVSQSNGQKSNLTYYLERSGNSWKIYDLAIEGVSFLKNYQSQFQTFNDMNALLVKLAQLNSGVNA